jgi:Tol biopolymer transport system component/DNA-binding winged helix-turn-helix (wHTH) protein
MEPEMQRYQFDTVEVLPAAFSVSRDGRRANLEPKAVRVLLYLIEHRDKAVGKDELIQTVWEGTAVTDNALTRIVAQIRRAIGDDAHQPRYIQTLPTVGYRFVAEVKVVRSGGEPELVRHTRQWRRPMLISAAVMVLIGTAAAWLLRKHGPGLPDGSHSVQLTTSPGLDIGTSFDPKGNSLAYSSNRSGRFEIYTRPIVSGGEDTQVTNDGKQNIDPAWSPDGKWIAYHSVAQRGIWLVPATGGVPRRLTAFGSRPAWAPDGRQIAFRATEPISFAWFDLGSIGRDPTIWIVTTDQSQLRRLTRENVPPGNHDVPTWSPDGKRLIFVAVAPESAIWSLDLASGAFEMLVKAGRDVPRLPGVNPVRLWDPKFSPAGKGLYFSATGDRGNYAIYLLRRAGERPIEICSTDRDAPSGLSLSPDGKRLAFTRFSYSSQLWTITPPADPKPLFQEAVVRVNLPNFSPDGNRLAFFVQTAGRNRDLWIMNADGTTVTPVSNEREPKVGSNVWTLDGTGLLYNFLDGPRTELRRYDPARKTSHVLYSWPSRPNLRLPVLMPDEREVLSSCSTPSNICLSAPQGGSPRQITFDREGASYPFISRDGQLIIYNVRRGDWIQIGITGRNGGRQEVLTDGPGLHWGHSFSGDNRRIAYAAYLDGVWNIWWIDRMTRERRQLTHYTAYGSFVRTPAWRPQTEQIVYEHTQVKGNVYLLDLPSGPRQ